MVQKQLAYMLGQQQIFLELDDDIEENVDLTEIMSNAHLNNNFLSLARELDIMEAKVPEDIYKSHLETQSKFIYLEIISHSILWGSNFCREPKYVLFDMIYTTPL